MRWPCVRFTVRGMMVAVAILAAFIKVEQAHERYWYYHERVARHDMEERLFRSMNGETVTFIVTGSRVAVASRTVVIAAAEVHARLRQKYERAAARPWPPVEPDPSDVPTSLPPQM
jgi:hypothetical protein